jgi:hypothetical protein
MSCEAVEFDDLAMKISTVANTFCLKIIAMTNSLILTISAIANSFDPKALVTGSICVCRMIVVISEKVYQQEPVLACAFPFIAALRIYP